ncbi:MAG TPA: hypothetical protein VF212_04115 [Longimicrobiales bacterium]
MSEGARTMGPAAAPRRPMAAGAPLAGGLAASNAPPFRLPGEHFAAGLGFLVLGALGLVWVAPALAQGLFPLPRVVAVTHLFTLGWITTSILGALYQFLPVALLEPVRSERLAHVSYWLYVPGVVAFVCGVAGGHPTVLVAGAATFGTALVLFAGNLAATLVRVKRRDLTWWALASAGVFLLVTVLLGLLLAINLQTNALGEHRFATLGVHLHIALVGWVFLVIIGVARHLLPMFLLSHGAGLGAAKLSVALVAAGTFLLALLHHVLPVGAFWIAGALMAAGVAAFLFQAGLFYRHRIKPKLDPGMRLAGVALAFFALALVLAPIALGQGLAAPRLLTGYVATLVLGTALFVAAHYYKILPFLVWYHRFGPLAGKRPVPRVAELYAARTANTAAALLALGALGLVLAILAGSGTLARTAALAFASGACVEAAQMYSISRRRPE